MVFRHALVVAMEDEVVTNERKRKVVGQRRVWREKDAG